MYYTYLLNVAFCSNVQSVAPEDGDPALGAKKMYKLVTTGGKLKYTYNSCVSKDLIR